MTRNKNDKTRNSGALDLSSTSPEAHVSQALRNAFGLTDGKPIGATDALIGALLQATSARSPSAAFAWLRERFKGFDPSAYPLKRKMPKRRNIWPVTPTLADSYSVAEQFLSKGGMWGRDYITIALLTQSDPVLERFVEAHGMSLAQLRDDWFRFVLKGTHRDHSQWSAWWEAGKIPIPTTAATEVPRAATKEVELKSRKRSRTKLDVLEASALETAATTDAASTLESDIRLYQRIKGLAADGIIGPRTRAAMQEDKGRLERAVDEITKPHRYRDSVSWQLTTEGIAVEGSPPEGSSGDPETVARVWGDFRAPIERAATLLSVPVELIVATICNESGGIQRKTSLDPSHRSDDETPDRVAYGLMQTLLSTARSSLKDDSIDGAWLQEPANSILAGTAYIASQWDETHYDPPKVACAYAVGGVRHDDGAENRWKMRQYPSGTSEYADRFVRWFNDCFRYFAENDIRPQLSLYRLLAAPDAAAPEPRFEAAYLLPGFDADDTSGDDQLDIKNDVEAFAMLLAAKAVKPPLAIGLFGDWGSGKTFFMDKLSEEIARIAAASHQAGPQATTAYHGEIVQIKFNAWNYVEANLWASLVTHIFEELNAYFTPKRDEEREQWQRLLKKLNEASLLRRDAEQNLKAAKDELQVAQQEVETETVNLWAAIDAAWNALRQDKRTSDDIARLERALGTESFKALKHSLLKRGEEVEQLAHGASLMREMVVRQLASPSSAAAFFAVVGTALAIVLAIGASDLKEQIQTFATRIGEFVALLGGISAWAGTALAKTNSAMKTVESIATSVDEALKQTPEGLALQQAKQRMMVAEDELEQRRQRVADLRSKLDDLRPSAQLSKFLSDRAESADYRKYLGLPAMISRDFEQLHRLMDRQTAQTFTVPSTDDILRQLDAGEVPTALDEALGRIDVPLPGAEERAEAEAETTKRTQVNAADASDRGVAGEQANSEATAGESAPRVDARDLESGKRVWTIADDENGRTIDIEPMDDTEQLECTVQWRLPRIDRIVLYIDDLDRCPPPRVVEVLQAVHLLLSFPLFVVVVGVDARWVSRALLRHYRGQWHELASEMELPGHTASPHDYLEKIFQIPFWLRPMSEPSTRDLLEALAPMTTAALTAEPPDIGTTASTTEQSRDEVSETEMAPQTERPSPEVAEAVTASEPPPADAAQAVSDTVEPEEETIQALPEQQTPEEEEALEAAVDLNPQQLLLSAEELQYMQHLAPLLGRSPRSVKRFVNVYRLYRARVRLTGDEDFNRLLGTAQTPGTYHIALFLLALITGHPELAQVLLHAIADAKREQTLGEFVGHFQSEASKETPSRWGQMFQALDKQVLDMPIQHVQDCAAQVRRYSFRVGRL